MDFKKILPIGVSALSLIPPVTLGLLFMKEKMKTNSTIERIKNYEFSNNIEHKEKPRAKKDLDYEDTFM